MMMMMMTVRIKCLSQNENGGLMWDWWLTDGGLVQRGWRLCRTLGQSRDSRLSDSHIPADSHAWLITRFTQRYSGMWPLHKHCCVQYGKITVWGPGRKKKQGLNRDWMCVGASGSGPSEELLFTSSDLWFFLTWNYNNNLNINNPKDESLLWRHIFLLSWSGGVHLKWIELIICCRSLFYWVTWQSCGSTWLKSSTKTPHKPQQPSPPTHGPNDAGPTTGQCVLSDPKLLRNIWKNVTS